MSAKNISFFVGLLALLGVLFSWNIIFPRKAAAPVVTMRDPAALAGLETYNAPWPAEITHLADRLSAIGLPALSSEGSALHIHQHLDLFIEGKSVPVPAGIGVNETARFISSIHTHNETGIIHVESPTVQIFTLGQFFDIWGLRFTLNCIGVYCGDATRKLAVFVNGAAYVGDPRQLALASHQEIVIAFGTVAEMPKSIPLSYTFPAGD